MSFLTRWFSNSLQGIPQITSAAGTLVSALDAMLVNGFNSQTAASLTQTAGVATLVFSGSGHGFVQHSVIRISGASPSGWNGDYRVTGVSGANVTFACDDTLSTASGTISVKFAPAGWEVAYTGTNRRVYRSAAIDSTRCLLRVDDTIGARAACALYESMSDIDTGSSVYSVYCHKRDNSTGAPFALYADDRLFYFFSISYSPQPTDWRGFLTFGDIDSFLPGDTFQCCLSGQDAADNFSTFTRFMNAQYFALARGADQLPGSASAHLTSLRTTNLADQYIGVSTLASPTPSTNGVHPVPCYVVCENDLRGRMPGIFHAANQTGMSSAGVVVDVPGIGLMVLQPHTYPTARAWMSLGSWR